MKIFLLLITPISVRVGIEIYGFYEGISENVGKQIILFMINLSDKGQLFKIFCTIVYNAKIPWYLVACI